MSDADEKKLRVFYSWQSDLPGLVNMKLIRNALNDAAGSINGDLAQNLHVVIDEATRDVPGSPNIAESIFAKIRAADVFVCDLTKTAESDFGAGKRKFCNPNVAIELGYAIRVLGWNRIVIVFNRAYGAIPDDLPFDARGHRTLDFSCGYDIDEYGKPTEACKLGVSNAKGQLRTSLVTALNLIAQDDPKRPHELELKTSDEVRRERDLEQLKSVFHWINVNMLDRFIERVRSGRLLAIGLDFCGFLETAINSAGFHLYDSKLKSLLLEFQTAWDACGKHANSMEGNRDISELRFVMPGDVARTPEQGQQLRETINSGLPLRSALDALLEYVREEYVEINVTQTGVTAVREFLAECPN